MTLRRSVTVLGSTGSIGVSTLDLLAEAVAHGSAEVEIIALTAGRNVDRLAEQARLWRPKLAVIADARLVPDPEAITAEFNREFASMLRSLKPQATKPAVKKSVKLRV